MSEKLSERMNRDGGHSTVYVPEVAALEQQLAAKDAEIARLRELLSNRLPHQLESVALAETPATPIRQCRCDVDKGYRDSGCVRCIPKSEPPAAPKEPRVILPPHVKQGFCDRHNRKWEEIDIGDGFAFTCRECRNERIKSHDAPLTALALPEDDVPDTASETEV